MNVTSTNLKLLSINAARKILGVRHETVKKLIHQNKLKSLIINNRVKIPFWSLHEFQVSQTEINNHINTSPESSENEIIQKIINKNIA